MRFQGIKGFHDFLRHTVPRIGSSAIKLYKSVGLKIPMNPVKHPLWIVLPTNAAVGFGMGFGMMTFFNLVEVEGRTKPDGTRKITSYYRLQARRNPEQYLGTI